MNTFNTVFINYFMDAWKLPLPPPKKENKSNPNSTVIVDSIYVLRHQPGVSEGKNVEENKVVYLRKT